MLISFFFHSLFSENFDVGQNIAYKEKQCVGSGTCNLQLNSIPDWPYVIKMFFDEVAIFDKKYLNSVVFLAGKEYGHLTQVIIHIHTHVFRTCD